MTEVLLRKMAISHYFKSFQIKSSCLAQSYILYQFLINKGKNPKIIMGYIVNHPMRLYYGHFWVECDGEIHDIATDTYLLDFDESQHEEIKQMRRLYKCLPGRHVRGYKNIDSIEFERKRDQSYEKCLSGNFLDDVKNTAPTEIYNIIAIAHEKLSN